MVCANVECLQEPATHITHLADGMIDALTLLGVKDNRLRLELALVAITPTITAWEVGRLVSIVETIDRPALVAVQPCSVTTERDQITEREIGIVATWEEPPYPTRSLTRVV